MVIACIQCITAIGSRSDCTKNLYLALGCAHEADKFFDEEGNIKEKKFASETMEVLRDIHKRLEKIKELDEKSQLLHYYALGDVVNVLKGKLGLPATY